MSRRCHQTCLIQSCLARTSRLIGKSIHCCIGNAGTCRRLKLSWISIRRRSSPQVIPFSFCMKRLNFYLRMLTIWICMIRTYSLLLDHLGQAKVRYWLRLRAKKWNCLNEKPRIGRKQYSKTQPLRLSWHLLVPMVSLSKKQLWVTSTTRIQLYQKFLNQSQNILLSIVHLMVHGLSISQVCLSQKELN